jgi:hypothetical protein
VRKESEGNGGGVGASRRAAGRHAMVLVGCWLRGGRMKAAGVLLPCWGGGTLSGNIMHVVTEIR